MTLLILLVFLYKRNSSHDNTGEKNSVPSYRFECFKFILKFKDYMVELPKLLPITELRVKRDM